MQAKIRNYGPGLDQVDLDVIADRKDWAMVEPRQLALESGAEATAWITFQPPPAAEHEMVSFALSARFGRHPYEASWARGAIDVVSRLRLRAEVRPREFQFRFSGGPELLISNLDSVALNVAVEAIEPEPEMTVQPEVANPLVQPLTQSSVGLNVRARQRLWWRQPQEPIPFRLRISPEGDLDPVTAEGALLRLPVFPVSKRTGIVLGVLLVAAAIAAAIWSVTSRM